MVVDGITNGFLAKYQANGELDWLKGMLGTGFSEVRAVVATGNNVAVMNGLIQGEVQIGDTTLITTPDPFSANIFMASCNGDLSATSIADLTYPNHTLQVFPNPTTEVLQLRLEHAQEFSFIRVSDLQGRILIEKRNPNERETLKVDHLARGIYLLTVRGDKGIISRKIRLR